MKLTAKGQGDFTPHPETDGLVKAVIVDVTPPKTVETPYGPKEKFRIVYETEMLREDGSRYCVWSPGYTPSLNEKSGLRRDLRRILGRDLTAQECDEFDTESLVGKGVQLIVQHDQRGEKTYANIAHICPDKGKALVPCGKYTRVQDRETADGEKAGYRRAEQSDEAGRDEWQKCKVHVGKHAGVDLGDLDEDAVRRLIEVWLPKHEASAKKSADDKRLAAALAEAGKLVGAAKEELDF